MKSEVNHLVKIFSAQPPKALDLLENGDVDITKLKPKELRQVRQKEMAMVLQQFDLLPHRTVLEKTVYGLEADGVSQENCETQPIERLSMVDLEGHANSDSDELRGRMNQRVGRALTNNPDTRLMDEAFNALDPLIQEEMQSALVNIEQKQILDLTSSPRT